MPRHARQLAESAIYHLMLRGVNRDAIFLDDEDFERFLHALGVTKELSGCAVLAYCLMPNHVHLVVRTAREPLATVMKRLGVRYAGWFNRKYGRVGHLFQDRFRSRPVETDEYFAALLRYVWANPVEAGIVARPEEYRWSSRRLVGQGSGLVDHDQLAGLLPDYDLNELEGARPRSAESVLAPPPDRRGQHEVERLLYEISGACRPADFQDLRPSARQRAVNELRARGVRYQQIALATGLSVYAVRKLQAAGKQPVSSSRAS